MSLRSAIIGQFRRPRGLLGRLVGRIMANRASNRARNAWTIDLLQIAPGDRVLELGCGPGYALELALARASNGHVTGIDHSVVMIEQAGRRNRAAQLAGQLALHVGSVTVLDGLSGPFDKIFSSNVLLFLSPEERARLFLALSRTIAPDGRIATTFQPRVGDDRRGAARKFAAAITAEMSAAGFRDIRTEESDGGETVCVLGAAPAA